MYLPLDDTARWRMGWSRILWAGLGLMCFLGAPSSAPAAADDRRSSSAPVHADSTGAAPARDTRIKSERAFDRMAPQAHTQIRAMSKGRHAAPVTLRGMRSGAARVFPTPGLGGHGASQRNTIPVPPMTAPASIYLISGPRVQTSGRLGGAMVRRTNHGAAIDGTQLRRKF